MADEFKHTTAAEMEEFLSKTDAEQKLRIWLNGRETNGEVARAWREIASQGLEIQKVRLQLSNHIEKEKEEQEGIEYIKRWGRRGTGAILLAMALLGGIEAAVLIFHYTRGWI